MIGIGQTRRPGIDVCKTCQLGLGLFTFELKFFGSFSTGLNFTQKVAVWTSTRRVILDLVQGGICGCPTRMPCSFTLSRPTYR